jgi:hypothetical protein
MIIILKRLNKVGCKQILLAQLQQPDNELYLSPFSILNQIFNVVRSSVMFDKHSPITLFTMLYRTSGLEVGMS